MENSDKIKILFVNQDVAGVNYFRTQTPAIQLEKDHSDKFYVEINSTIDFNNPTTIDYLKTFHIIHYHRTLVRGTNNMLKLANELKSAGVTLVVDIDDYWKLDKSHPFYGASVEQQLHLEVIDNLKIADYVTTTTDIFATEIKKVTGKDNVAVLPNAIDPTWMKQFQDNKTEDPDGLVRITYAGGSSHGKDVEQLNGVINMLNSDPETKGKFKIIVAGWDTQGSTTDVKFNQEFGKELKSRGLWDRNMVKTINKCAGNIDQIPNVPNDLILKYRDKVFFHNKRDIESNESIYLVYENILTDNHKLIDDDQYIKWLEKYERDQYGNEKNFARRWTQKANIYAKVLDETDISLAPLGDHIFNNMKSPLKQVECWTRKIPIVCSDIAPYNVDGINGENCVLIPTKKNAHKYWYKALKKLILNKEYRETIGENLYNNFKEKYNLKNVTENRANFYNEIMTESLIIK